MPVAKEIIDRALRSKEGETAYGICEALLDAGHEAWWVGGCVRDMLLERIPDDIDIATSATPRDVAKLFPKCDESRADLGTIIVAKSGCTFEITTFREESAYNDGREPQSVKFTDRPEDASRRDITINALYWNPISSELFDPYEGEKDLHERLIRIIGVPKERLAQDALRLLRVIRFRALIDGQYHPETYNALHMQAKLSRSLSGFRVFQELEKILLGPHPSRALEDLWETDILETLIPELHACKGVGQPSDPHTEGDVWNHILGVVDACTEDHGPDVRFAAFFHDIGKPETFSIEDDRIHFNDHAKTGATIARNILTRFQCPTKRSDKIHWLIEHHMMMGTFSTIGGERKAYWYHHPWFVELLQLFWLDIAGTGKQDFSLYEEIITDYNFFLDTHPRVEKPLLSGDEIMEILGIGPGEEVGKLLKSLHEAQVRKEVNSKKEAKDFLGHQTV